MAEGNGKRCETCRYWTAPQKAWQRGMGACSNKFAHYGAKVECAGGFAMIDTFGEPDTPPTYVCDQWTERAVKEQGEMVSQND